MTNAELNEYIKHYIENDKTNSAIMLTAPWGTGKSYYIKNRLIPFLEGKTDAKGNLIIKDDNSTEGIKKTKCIVISLYGIYDIETISKNIYLELRSINVFPDNEAFTTGKVVAKTVLKGLLKTTLNFDVKDYEIEKEDLENIYKSVDLSDILLIFEDIERSNIDIIKFMGYINNLVEQDGVRVLLVTNEDEIIKYDCIPIETGEKALKYNFLSSDTENQVIFTEKAEKYLAIKEKSIIDTIKFNFDYEISIRDVIKEFTDPRLNDYIAVENIKDIYDIMCDMESKNLRALKFACQKTIDIFDTFLDEGSFTNDFKKKIFYGNIYIALAIKSGTILEWNGDNYYSAGMFLNGFPIAKFCFDYILEQKVDKNRVAQTVIEYNKIRLYDTNKNDKDWDFLTLLNWYKQDEKNVSSAISSIISRLKKHKNEIAFVNYPKIIKSLLELSGYIEYDLEEFTNVMCRHLKGERENVPISSLMGAVSLYKGSEIYTQYKSIMERFVYELSDKKTFVELFDYSPQNSAEFYNDTADRKTEILKNATFTSNFDAVKLAEMFLSGTSEQMNLIRYTFLEAYKDAPKEHHFISDKQDIEQIYEIIKEKKDNKSLDAIKRKQCDMFLGNLELIMKEM